MSKITYQCPECGSRNVGLADVTAYWSETAQDWCVGGDRFTPMCHDCGAEEGDTPYKQWEVPLDG